MPVEGIRKRLVTALLAMAVLVVVLFLLPPIFGVLALALLVAAGAWEWTGFFGEVTPAQRAAFLALIVAALAVSWFAVPLQPLLLLALGWWVLAFLWIFRFPTPIPRWLVFTAGLLVLVPGWMAVAHLHFYYGPEWLMVLLLVIGGADTGAFFTGKAFGRTRLAPGVSPGKTWEGAVGGLVLAATIAAFSATWLGLPRSFLVSLCLAVALISIVGDLTISMFKRNAGLKDSGRLFPGHGGVLDRVDSLSAGAPLFVFGLGWLGHIT